MGRNAFAARFAAASRRRSASACSLSAEAMLSEMPLYA